jgi:lambda repressor-like predicted transcriptional regulator
MYDLASASMAADAEQVLSQQWKRYEQLIADVCAAPAKQTE